MPKDSDRIKMKSEYMNRFISNVVLLNGGTASVFFSVSAANWDKHSFINIFLLVLAAILAWFAGEAASCDFERMTLHDVQKTQQSYKIDERIKSALRAFKWVIVLGSLIAISVQMTSIVSIECIQLDK